MTSAERIRTALAEQRLEDLFVEELGWNATHGDEFDLRVGEREVVIREIARKAGFRVFVHEGPLPTYPVRQRLDRQLSRVAAEHFLVFLDPSGEQHWQWTQIRSGRSSRLVTHGYHPGGQNEGLVGRLEEIKFALKEEGSLTILGVSERVEGAFRAEAVTDRFYQRFRRERDTLLGAIEGFEHDADREWYASLLMNRLMFLHFLQKRGFLAGDRNYLQNRFDRVQQLRGPDRFHSFFRDFLIPLCHNALGRDDLEIEDEELAELVGDVPYVNGGIFSQHGLEKDRAIEVPDRVFAQIFDFFDSFRWHLDERPGSDQNEIDPDVLGYVFERYVNQKEVGAYYTQVDVTRFMVSSALVPVFLERLGRAATETGLAFRSLELLEEEPERYVYSALGKGAGEEIPVAIRTCFARDSADPSLSDDGDDTVALPGESWREALSRLKRREDHLDQLASGAVTDIDTAVAMNLDIRRLAIDSVLAIEDPALARLSFDVLRELTILDPACGSGAFLFAALDLLEDLYDASLTALEGLLDEAEEPEPILAEVDEHPSRTYFIAKTAALSNLFGVDIMPEAVEIAKLRLFLKLVSGIGKRGDLEPLPDLDFNIRAGNSLVGFSTPDAAIAALEQSLLSVGLVDDIIELSDEAEALFDRFVEAQSHGEGYAAVSEARSDLNSAQARLSEALDAALAESRSISSDEIASWRDRERPFHWFVEFNQVVRRGGFDVVVGNPPYVGMDEVRERYPVEGFATDDCPDVFAPMMEQGANLVAPEGRMAFIVPIALMFSREYPALRAFLTERFPHRWASSFGRNPAALFDGNIGVRPTIFVGAPGDAVSLWSSRTHRWYEEFRPALFETLRYTHVPSPACEGIWPKTDDAQIVSMLESLGTGARVGDRIDRQGQCELGHRKTALYVISAYLREPPCYDRNGELIAQPDARTLRFRTRSDAHAALLLFAGKLMLAWWAVWGDDFHVTGQVLESFPLDPSELARDDLAELESCAETLDQAMQTVIDMTPYAGRLTGNYALNELREITDRSDAILARHLGIEEYWPAVQLLYDHLMKKTGERPGVFRLDPDQPIEVQSA